MQISQLKFYIKKKKQNFSITFQITHAPTN